MTNNIEHQHDIIKKGLFQFINLHLPGTDLRIVDEIVLSYVVSILEEASQDEAYEVEEFMDMMSAYFPKFSNIKKELVCSWICDLNNQLLNQNKSSNTESQGFNLE